MKALILHLQTRFVSGSWVVDVMLNTTKVYTFSAFTSHESTALEDAEEYIAEKLREALQ